MIRNLIIIVLLAIIAFFLYRYEEEKVFEKDMEQTKSNIENIYLAESAEESQKYVEDHNTRAKQEMVYMKQRAKAPASIKFVELTQQQNRYADESTLYTSQLIPLIKKMEGMDPASSDPVVVKNMLTEFCTTHKKYLGSLESVQNILIEKLDMINKHPVILQEIVGGTPEQREQVKSVMQLMLDNQSNVLIQEQQYRSQIQCSGDVANTNGIQQKL